MTSPAAVITAARALIGKPFVHQSRDVLRGVDCSGLLMATFGQCGWNPRAPELTLRSDYAVDVDDDVMLRTAQAEADPVEFAAIQPADVILFKWQGYQWPQHVALVTEWRRSRPYIIHSTRGGVIEHALGGELRGLVHSCWRVKGVQFG